MDQNILEGYMRYCLRLARLGLGSVSPNPTVGSILVHENRIIGSGYHQRYGEAHAEANAIHSVLPSDRKYISESTLFVSLEPCNHFGKTPPCSQLILRHGIRKLVFGTYDPNPVTSGTSIDFLRNQGVEVTGPVLNEECQELIAPFTVNQKLKRPYVILKFAQSSDFLIGQPDKRIKISNPYSDLMVHKWRSQVDGILVGGRTVRIDDPQLTTRLWPGKHPVRLVLGHFSEAEKNRYRVFDDQATTLSLDDLGFANSADWPELLREIYKREIGILMVEGGAQTLDSIYSSGLWDEARVITNQGLKLGRGVPAPSIRGRLVQKIKLDQDVIHYIKENQGP
ncbi:MAG TPA: bifunctional diaminohydroxyphosphoribosylaminopyrimidine deaminase/5-amino-6-(5-phosphoribosylamino)uracil reductase RibD [Saprospiraceae bacterium]|nr:bifunctional diaminohydroxyphosphoribosylaminopyrimidine deaminase/5-amino-6-(5-phosphoribosylamino)uracil reductase RibD [Saprospiraceae bacterium]